MPGGDLGRGVQKEAVDVPRAAPEGVDRALRPPLPERQHAVVVVRLVVAWEKQVLSARGFKRVGRHSEYAIQTVWRCVSRGPGVRVSPLSPLFLSPWLTTWFVDDPAGLDLALALVRAEVQRGVPVHQHLG